MSKWVLVYAFSKKLSTSDVQFNKSLDILKYSIIYNKRYHKLKIYTDTETFLYIKDFGIDIEIFDFEKFIFLDDIKIQILPILNNNEVLIDPDIFLFSELKIPTEYDVVLDRPVNVKVSWLQEQIELSKNYEFSKLINFKPKNNKTGNIGIMKFFNKKLENSYIEFYKNVKSVAETEENNLPPFPSFSILLGELGLKTVIDNLNCKIVFLSEIRLNKYDHVAGPRKYDFDSIKGYLRPIEHKII